MKRRTIKAVLVGISAMFMLAILLKPQGGANVGVGEKHPAASVQYASGGALPGSMFYAEK